MTKKAKRAGLGLLGASVVLGTFLWQAKRAPLTLVGQPAPVFSLPDQTGSAANLADQKGKWVVLQFYPMDGTHG